MLKLKYLFEDYQLAKTALGNYEYDQEGLDEMLTHFKISSNAVYPYKYKNRIHFLRIKPACETQLSWINAELDFLEYLNGADYPCNKPILSKSGQRIVTLNYGGEAYYCTCLLGFEGDTFEDGMSAKNVYECGKLLGRLHRLSQEYTAKQDKRYSMSDTLDFIKTQIDTFEMSQLSQIALDVCEQIEALPKTMGYGLIHGDYEKDNVVYSRRDNTYGVIDFDDTMYGYYAYDQHHSVQNFADLLGRRGKKYAEEFARGYREYATFDSNMGERAKLFDDYTRLLTLSRITYAMADQPDIEQPPRWYTLLLRKLTVLKHDLMDALLPNGWQEQMYAQECDEEYNPYDAIFSEQDTQDIDDVK